MCKPYNGYTNYETWAIALWLDNDQGTQEYMIELTEQANKPYELADMIKDYIEENNPLNDQASMYSDLLQSAIDNCNFDEIADNYWTEYHKDEEEQIMEKDKEVTKVIFRVFTDGYSMDDVIAIFPELPGDMEWWTCLSYAHIGQHGSCDINIIRETYPALPITYAPLLQELESLGYNLKVCKRISWEMTYKMHRGLK